jgi:hypothetical protein
MDDFYQEVESDNIPLASVVSGDVSLDRLIEELTDRWPDRTPRIEISSFDLGRLAGAMEVIDFIKAKRNR